MKILIIDDEELLVKGISYNLENEGYQVVTGTNGLEAIRLARPGVIAAVTSLMRWEYADLNICNFHLSRERRGGDAIMTIEIDNQPPDTLIGDIRKLENVTNALLIRRL